MKMCFSVYRPAKRNRLIIMRSGAPRQKGLMRNKTSLTYRFTCAILRMIVPRYDIKGEPLPRGEYIVVANHSQMYCPVVTELYFPGDHYMWCTEEMMDHRKVADYTYRDFWSQKPRAVRWFFWLLSRLLKPAFVSVFSSARLIPVYHDMRLKTTFRTTIRRLSEGSCIMITPENKSHYNNIINDFQDRFINIAPMYYRSSGKCLRFVPMYLAPELKTMCFGKAVEYCPDRPDAEERARIRQELMNSITDIALSLPLHDVVPYDNVPRKRYRKNRPLVWADDAVHTRPAD